MKTAREILEDAMRAAGCHDAADLIGKRVDEPDAFWPDDTPSTTLMCCAFTWKATPEGHAYWYGVYCAMDGAKA